VGAVKYPLRTALKKYLEERADNVEPRTLDNQTRILKKLVEEIEAGKVKGLTTTNPYLMGQKDARAILDYLKSKELENETTLKYLQFLNGLLLSCNNHSLDDLRTKSPHLFPKRIKKPVRYLKEPQLNTIRDAAEEIEGWMGSVLRFIVAAYPGTGLRPSELRTAQRKDLDTKKWTLRVRHPKGEGTFGYRRTVAIMPPFREAILSYILEREEYLRSKGMDSIYLVPALVGGKDAPYSSNHFRKIKKELEVATGIDFRLKDFRSTFATLTRLRDRNSESDVSFQMGHSSPEITHQLYMAIDAFDGSQRLVEAWEQKPCSSDGVLGEDPKKELDTKPDKNVLIKPKEYMTGYG
jgi:integrase